MARKSIQVRIDEKLKRQAEQVFSTVGIDTPTAIRIFFTKVVDNGDISFALVQNTDHYSEEQLRRIDEAYEESLHPENLIGPFDTVDAMLKYINNPST